MGTIEDNRNNIRAYKEWQAEDWPLRLQGWVWVGCILTLVFILPIVQYFVG